MPSRRIANGQRKVMFLPISVAALLGGAIASPGFPPALVPRQTSEQPVRTGNWSTLSCETDGYFWGTNGYWTPMDRWGRLGCKHAWDDVIAEWKDDYRLEGKHVFSVVVMSLLRPSGWGQCGIGFVWSDCDSTASCSDRPAGIKPAGAEVSNAIATIHEVSGPDPIHRP